MEKLQNSMTKLTLYKQKEDYYSWVIFKKKEKNTFQQKKVIICPKTLLFTWQKLYYKKSLNIAFSMRCEMTCLSPGTLASSSSMVAEQLSSLVMRASNQPRERETGSVFERDPMRRRMAQLHPGTRVRVPINTARLNSHKKRIWLFEHCPFNIVWKKRGQKFKSAYPV